MMDGCTFFSIENHKVEIHGRPKNPTYLNSLHLSSPENYSKKCASAFATPSLSLVSVT